MRLPDGYLPVMPYLIVKDAAEFITFMENVFHAKLRYSAPRSEGVIKHAELQIEQAVLLCSVMLQMIMHQCRQGFFYMLKMQMKFLTGLWQQVLRYYPNCPTDLMAVAVGLEMNGETNGG